MIQIKRENLPEIANKHYEGVMFWTESALDFYSTIIGVWGKCICVVESENLDNYKLNIKSLQSFTKLIIKTKKTTQKIRKEDIIGLLKGRSIFKPKPFFTKENCEKLFELLHEVRINLKKIIVGQPLEIFELERIFRQRFSSLVEENQFVPSVRVILEKIFNYDKFTDKTGFALENKKYWEAYDLAKELDVNVCPYCNRNYIFVVLKQSKDKVDSKKIIRPQFDHFFNKSKHPLFGLSFYNLIPSCSTCNSTLKGVSIFDLSTHLHPYLNSCTDHAYFDYTPNTTAAAVGESHDLQVSLKPREGGQLETQIINSSEIFQVDIIYSKHADVVSELIRKKHISNDKYLETLQEQYKDLHLTMEELYRLAFGNYYHEDDFEKRPMAKLTKDICKRLGLIK
ncbi:hypothetical protein QNI16_18255 [Cytophagaceae bacterium YF14B1]|uniref:HNH endonuclease n=1 Tax=Xanthocytophaga flava TaxID=3048013 RepID=A0AAE3QN80_9BACT|nr:hypothetical protein [Xanthocytophaga flavus]MDJ1482452.1 hypothetical protein [Xanthocytophaga flavus]